MHTIGVCSWSLRPSSPSDLVEQVKACGLAATQLHLDPLRTGAWHESELASALRAGGVRLLSGMMSTQGEDYSSLESIQRTGGIRPDRHWSSNLAAAEANARLARRLGIALVSFHAGFLPHERGNAERARLVERLRRIADIFAAEGVDVAFETGQESAATLLDVLAELERPRAGINFDPANMILYGMGEPVAALRLLAARVKQIHIKDALPSPRPGEWGSEVPVGGGAVDWKAFFTVVREKLPGVDLCIEREAGEQRVADVRAARALLARELGSP